MAETTFDTVCFEIGHSQKTEFENDIFILLGILLRPHYVISPNGIHMVYLLGGLTKT